MINVLEIVSRNEVYFRTMLTEVNVYRSTGALHPGRLWIKFAINCLEPWYREIWFGCDDTPAESNVMRTSIVAVGAVADFDVMTLAS